MEAISKMIPSRKGQQVKELHREGGGKDGLLSRQRAEPVTSYTARRKRWHTRLSGLDEGMKLPENIQTDVFWRWRAYPMTRD